MTVIREEQERSVEERLRMNEIALVMLKGFWNVSALFLTVGALSLLFDYAGG